MRADLLRGGPRGRRALAASVVAAAVCGTVLTAAPAHASAPLDPIGIGYVTADDLDHGSFGVAVWTDQADTTVTSVTATVLDAGAPVAVRSLLDNGYNWGPGNPLKLVEDGGELPRLGRYDVELTATDSKGETVTRTEPGALDFTMIPVFTKPDGTPGNPVTLPTGAVTFDPAVVDADHTSETVGGALMGRRPGSGVLVPLAGRTVSVVMGYGQATKTAETGADGRFGATFALSDEEYFTASYTEESDQAHGRASTPSAQPQYQDATVAVTATANLKRVLPGQSLTLSGDVHTTTGSVTELAGVPVVASFQSYQQGGGFQVHAVTDAGGHFTLALPGDPESNGTWAVDVDQPFRHGEASGTVALPDESVLTGVSSSLSVDDRVTVSGKLLRTYHRGDSTYGQNVGLWYSPDGKTGWKGLAGTNLTSYDGSFKITTFGYLDGYYQVRHAVSDQLVASNGPVVHLTRTNTRIFQMYANSARVKKGSTLTLTGNLKQDVGGVWKPYAGQHVELYFQPKGSTRWTYLAYGRTDSTGHAKFTSKAVQDGRWLIQYFGDATHFESDAAAVFVDVV